ncbi:MAG: isoprenylcysteine carboxylmethyltransferase family protein [Bacteroidaceae bacterium]|nr:isoprenylcysteine carboxylmethyltransferase family protein [Bacteroidaceae bacterium]
MMKLDIKLMASASIKFLMGLVLVGLLIFLPAGTMDYPCGWLLMAVLFVPMFIAGVVMALLSPRLLKKRLDAKEKEDEQKSVVAMSAVMFIAAFVVAGLNHRYSWSVLPSWAVWVAVALFLLSYLMYARVLRENAYLSRTIEVQQGQKVVDTGLYRIVRHPMYSATILLFLSMPLVLGSLPSFVIMLAYIPLIVKRIRNEETVLLEGLDGYADYCSKVKYRIIPFVW